MLEKIITFSFYILFLLTPLFWTPLNYELFEYNKMILVYLLTVIITGAWLLKTIKNKSLTLNQTPLDIPILLFLGANILSTIFSIDQFTSIFGYYSRSNGGLLSIISYTLLFFAFVNNIDKNSALKILKIGLLSGFLVSLWAIPEHFGVSPSCLILRGEFSANCWVQDVQARVFATLGQPNWLASYLSMLIFPALYFLLTSIKKLAKVYYGLLIILYLAFTFTFSRSGFLGLIAGMVILILLQTIVFKSKRIQINLVATKPLIPILAALLLINITFGSALTRFQISNLFTKSQPAIAQKQTAQLTQLENGGTESGEIRLIVWHGALDIFKHYPIFGSGVETFAYSYYQFRPASHNLVSEWDFLYNKAHNEFLNYLANTGILGFGSYLSLIIIFTIWALKQKNLLVTTILSSLVAFHVQNFFGFSVVITALFFYLFPAIAFVTSNATKSYKISIFNFIYQKSFFTKLLRVIVVFICVYFLFLILKMWLADTLFAIGQRSGDSGDAGKAYNYLTQATSLNKNPFYLSELGYSAASAALALKETDATLSSQLSDQAVSNTNSALNSSPRNVSFYRTAVRTFYLLSEMDSKFTQKALDTLDKAITLAPTDPKLYYNKAVILGQINENQKAVGELNKAIKLKPNYREAYFAIALFLFDLDKKDEAVLNMQKVLTLVPNDPDALKQLTDWGKLGIATNSALKK